MIKIVLAPDKFKHSLSAREVCDFLEIGLKKSVPNLEVIAFPMADGGEGTLDVLIEDLQLSFEQVVVKDPLFRDVTAAYAITSDRKQAYIEMASASGLMLLSKGERNPMKTSTFGTGQLIKDAMEKGVDSITLFIGGSGTNDGGIGMASALGYRFLDADGNVLPSTGEQLIRIQIIDDTQVYSRLSEVGFIVATDVTNSLTGEHGAALMYGPQKGASGVEVEQLERGLQQLSSVAKSWMGNDKSTTPGAGAAGGLGFGAMVFLGAQIQSGVETVIETLNLNGVSADADLVISGEGNLDQQSLYGKVIDGVRHQAHINDVPFGVVCGGIQLSQEELKANHILFSQSLEELSGSRAMAIAEAGYYVGLAAEKLGRDFIDSLARN